jgi:clan AA aspartic protease
VTLGSVNSELEALVRLLIRGPQWEIETEAVVDTGFNGALTLPSDLIAKLGLRLKTRMWGMLADGRADLFDVYEALIFWNGRLRRISVNAAESDPLLGMSLLQGNELAIQVVDGGEVFIRELGFS